VSRQLALCVIERGGQRICDLISESQIEVDLPARPRIERGLGLVTGVILTAAVVPGKVCRTYARVSIAASEIVIERVEYRSREGIRAKLLIERLVNVETQIR